MWVSKTVSFAGTCSARGELCLCSDKIMRPFRTRSINVRFPQGTQNLMSLQFFLSPDDETPSSGQPSGSSLLQDYGQVTYVRGDATNIELAHFVFCNAGGFYLKVYADNNDFYDHDVDATITIEVEEPTEN